MSASRSITRTSRLNASAPKVWARVTSFDGINEELMPLMRMTAPSHIRSLSPQTVTLGERVCRSWILLFGLIPVDYDDIVIVELEPGRRFVERSTMLSARAWQHERIVEPDGSSSATITDRVTFQPRVGFTGPLLEKIVAVVFQHRHHRLERHFGTAHA